MLLRAPALVICAVVLRVSQVSDTQNALPSIRGYLIPHRLSLKKESERHRKRSWSRCTATPAAYSHSNAFMKSPLVFLLPVQSGSPLCGVRDTTGNS